MRPTLQRIQFVLQVAKYNSKSHYAVGGSSLPKASLVVGQSYETIVFRADREAPFCHIFPFTQAKWTVRKTIKHLATSVSSNLCHATRP